MGGSHVVTIGGGGGHSQVLKALKDIRDIRITGICPSTDSGGSTGVLREEYGGSGYTGDLTKCIVALSKNPVLANALRFRFGEGSLRGHSVKNLLFHALESSGDTDVALREFWSLCDLGEHRIIPVTTEETELCARLRMGTTISGETNIDTIARNPLWNPSVHSIEDVHLKPSVGASPSALEAIAAADYIVVCPGDLYSSILPTLLPGGMTETIIKSDAPIIMILNIMTKKGETDGYTAADFVANIEEYLGRPVNHIVCSDEQIPDEVLLRYSIEQKVVLDTLEDPRTIRAPLALVSNSGQILSDPEVIREVVERIMVSGG